MAGIISIGRLNVPFNEDAHELEEELAEYKKLEQAIVDSEHFKLLAGKTTMLGKGKGISKKERSRQVHSRNIERITRQTIEKIYDSIAEENPAFKGEYREIFELNKELALTKGSIIALSHDIGHVGCGHEGERAINSFFSGINDSKEVKPVIEEHRRYFGDKYEGVQGHIYDETFEEEPKSISFEHNELSAIIFNQIAQKANINLSQDKIRELTLGILGHSTSRTPSDIIYGNTIAQIVRVADKVEYINYDYEEISSLIKWDSSLEDGISRYFSLPVEERLEETTTDLAKEAINKGWISENHQTLRRLRRARASYEDFIYLYDNEYTDKILKELLAVSGNAEQLAKYYKDHPGTEAIYSAEDIANVRKWHKIVKDPETDADKRTATYSMIAEQRMHLKSLLQGENSERIHCMYYKLLKYYYSHPSEIPSEFHGKVTPIDFKPSEEINYSLDSNYSSRLQRTLEYISLFDDAGIINEYERLVYVRAKEGSGHGIMPVTAQDIKTYSKTMFDQKIREEARKDPLEAMPRTLDEVRSMVENKNRAFSEKLTPRGKQAKDEFFEARKKDFVRDAELLEKVEKADKARIAKTHKPVGTTNVKLLKLDSSLRVSEKPKYKRADSLWTNILDTLIKPKRKPSDVKRTNPTSKVAKTEVTRKPPEQPNKGTKKRPEGHSGHGED